MRLRPFFLIFIAHISDATCERSVPLAHNVHSSILAVENRSSLFEGAVLRLDNEDVTEDQFETEPSNVDELFVANHGQIMFK